MPESSSKYKSSILPLFYIQLSAIAALIVAAIISSIAALPGFDHLQWYALFVLMFAVPVMGIVILINIPTVISFWRHQQFSKKERMISIVSFMLSVLTVVYVLAMMVITSTASQI